MNIIQAIQTNNYDLFEKNINLSESDIVNQKDWFWNTPLHVAIKCGRSKMTKKLLEYGANINAKNKMGDTPLHLAVNLGRVNIVKKLLELGVNLNTQNYFEKVPLYSAVFSKTIIMQMLLKCGANINIQDRHGWSSLHKACNHNKLEKIELLLSFNADITIKTYNNETIFDVSNLKTKEFIHFNLSRRELWTLWYLD